MLRKLRTKFIALNMITVAVVLAVVFTVICVIDYTQEIDTVYSSLDAALSSTRQAHGVQDDGKHPPLEDSQVDNQGQTGEQQGGQATGETQLDSQMPTNAVDQPLAGDTSQTATNDKTATENESIAPPEIGGKPEGDNPFIPVAVYSVQKDSSTPVVESAYATASISDEVLETAIGQLSGKDDGSGKLDTEGLFYRKLTQGEVVYYAFADSSTANGWQSLAIILLGVGCATLLVFFVISVFFSRWALKPVKQVWSQQRQFVADASHELKTPLTVVLANTSILLSHSEQSIASQSQWIESTHSEAKRMQSLVNDLLYLARSDEEKAVALAPSSSVVDFSDLVEGQVLQFESVGFERALSFETAVQEGIFVEGERDKLERLVSILLDNACKYAYENTTVGVTLKRIELKKGKFGARFSVLNQGQVIDPDDLPHLFDRFYRADKARVRAGGFGLGLAIAKEITQAAGGSIFATSSDAVGTTFTVELPACSVKSA